MELGELSPKSGGGGTSTLEVAGAVELLTGAAELAAAGAGAETDGAKAGAAEAGLTAETAGATGAAGAATASPVDIPIGGGGGMMAEEPLLDGRGVMVGTSTVGV